MQEVEGERDLGRVKPGVLLGETSVALHMKHEVTPIDALNDEVESAVCLEAGVETHEERVIGRLLKDVLFRLHPVYVLQVVRGWVWMRADTNVKVYNYM